MRKNSDAASDEERGRLEPTGEFHLGEFVNRFRHGSLVMRMPDSEAAQIPTVIFGTVNGVIGVIASLPQEQFVYLHKLQNCLTEVRRLSVSLSAFFAAIVSLLIARFSSSFPSSYFDSFFSLFLTWCMS